MAKQPKKRPAAELAKIARVLDDAQRKAKPIPQLSSKRGGALSLDDAYRVQAAAIALRLKRGEVRSGVKMGLTSRAKAAQMGVFEPVYGRLTDGMLVADGGTVPHERFCHPRVEPEIAYLLKSPMSGRLSPAEAMAHVEAVAPAIEIIDSRYKDFRFSLEDVVADNTSASGYVVGPWARPDIDAGNLGMVLEFDGRAVEIGSSAAILGHPARALAEAARFAEETGDALKEGYIVLAGAASAAVALPPATSVGLTVEAIGRVAFNAGG
jgi:2-oxo-3-hexenedioate decarboxylase